MKKIENLRKAKTFESIIAKMDFDFGFESIEEKNIVKYFLLTDLINNKNLDELLKMKRNKKKVIFRLKELKKIEKEEQKIENNIIKVKNLF